MRRALLAVGVMCAVGVTGRSTAQFNTTSASNNSGTTMPGQVVGGYTGQVLPVGQSAPQAAPQAGQSITANGMQRPYDPNRPYDAFKGTGIDPKNVLAPLVGADGKPIATPDALDKLSERIKAFFIKNPPPPRPPYTPGITRRAKERTNQMWRRD